MTTQAEARASVYKRFLAAWTATTIYHLEGEPFDMTDETVLPPDTPAWARLSVRHLPNEGSTMGPPGQRKWTRRAAVYVEIMTPINTGMKVPDDLVQAARTLYEGLRYEGLVFEVSDPRERPASPPWQSIVVETRFSYEETR